MSNFSVTYIQNYPIWKPICHAIIKYIHNTLYVLVIEAIWGRMKIKGKNVISVRSWKWDLLLIEVARALLFHLHRAGWRAHLLLASLLSHLSRGKAARGFCKKEEATNEKRKYVQCVTIEF